MSTRKVSFILNGENVSYEVESDWTLLHLLKEVIKVNSLKKTCEHGDCGACSVLMDGKTVNSCLVLAASIEGKEITTVEGIGTPGKLHPLQKAFYEMGASQCGYCTPGFIISAKALLDENCDPTEEEVREALSGNLCRCTGYVKPVKAVLEAAKQIREAGE